MKRLVFILFVFSMIICASAEPVIPEKFYLNNEQLYDSDAVLVSNVLPNTLRLSIAQGEEYELCADILPTDATETGLEWSVSEKNKIIDIIPGGNKCTVRGLSQGEGNIRIEAENGVYANVAVTVSEPEKIPLRSFEYVGESNSHKNNENNIMNTSARGLTVLGIILVLFSIIYLIKSGRRME